MRITRRLKFVSGVLWLFIAVQIGAYTFSPATKTKHSATIKCIAFTADGSVIATGSDDSTIKMWDAMSGRELRTLTGHKASVSALAFSPDGKILVTGSYDKTVRLWSVPSGEFLDVLDTNFRSVANVPLSIAFDRTGKIVACGYDLGGPIRLYSIATRREIMTLSDHADVFTSLVFASHGDFLISGGLNGKIRIWDTNAGRELKTLATITNDAFLPNTPVPIFYIALGGADKVLVTSDGDFRIRRWNFITGQQFFDVEPLSGRRTAYSRPIALTSDAKALASGGADGIITLWNVDDGRELTQFSTGKASVSSLAFSPNGKTLASGSRDGDLELWTINPIRALWPKSEPPSVGSKLISSLPPEVRPKWIVNAPNVVSLALSQDGTMMAWGDSNGTVRILTPQTGATITTLVGSRGSVRSVAFSSDGRTVATGEDGDENSVGGNGVNGTLKLWSARTGALLRTFWGSMGTVDSVAFSPDGTMLACVDSAGENRIKLWNPRTGALLREFDGGSGTIAFSPDGKLIASSNLEGEVKLWDARTGLVVIKLKEQWGHTVAYSPNGKVLATIGGGGLLDKHFVKLWNVQTGQLIRTLPGSEGVNWMGFSADSRRLATCSFDGLALWSVETGESTWKLNRDTRCDIVIFSQDGKSLVTSSSVDGLIKSWHLSALK